MTFDLNPLKVMALFAPLWLLLAPSLWLYWDDWRDNPWLLAWVGGLPVWAALAAKAIGRRWRLELTKDALVHHSLRGAERFAWARMGAVETKRAGAFALFAATLWFAYPTDAPRDLRERALKLTGRRILLVFGDGEAPEIIKQIAAWRALYGGATSGQP